MKIAYFCLDRTSYAGSPNNEIQQSAFMAKEGHKVYLYTEGQTEFEGWKKPENLEIINLPIVKHVIGEGQMTKEEFEVILNNKVDCVFGSAVSAAPLTVAIGKMMNVPVINQILDIPMFRLKYKHWTDQWKPWLEALAQSDILVVNTKRAAEDLHKIFNGTLDSKVRIVYYGIDNPLCDSIPDQEKVYDVCMVARMVHYKYHDLLLYALAKLKQEGINLKTVLVGEGEEAFRLQEMCFNAGLDVRFVGAVSDEEKFKLIKQSKIGVYTDCCDEISGLFPAESMYCGLPTIIMDMPINHERFGDDPFYVPKFDIEDLVAWIRFLVKCPCNPDFLKRGKEFIKENRLFKHTASGILKAMEELNAKI